MQTLLLQILFLSASAQTKQSEFKKVEFKQIN